MKVLWILLVAFTIVALSSCMPPQGNDQNEDLVPSDSTVSPEGDPPTMTQTPIDPGLQQLVDTAKQDLALLLSIPSTEIDLVEAKAVVWPDSSLGCPQPGMQYLQVPEDGALVILQAAGINYEYHNGGSRGPFLCERTFTNKTPPPQIDLFNLTPPGTNPDVPTPDNGIPPGEGS